MGKKTSLGKVERVVTFSQRRWLWLGRLEGGWVRGGFGRGGGEGGDFACVVELVVGWWGGEDTVFTLKSSPVVLVGGLVEGGGMWRV